MDPALAHVFLASVPAAARPRFEAWTELAVVLEERVTSARTAWPSLEVSLPAFITHVAQRIDPDAQVGKLAELRVADMYLVFAATRGDTTALGQLERAYFRRLAPVVGRVAPEAADLVVAELRETLLLPNKPGGGLGSYAGQADLFTWLRVCAVRIAVQLHRRAGRQPRMEQEVLETLCVGDAIGGAPELDHERQRFAEAVREAVELAFAHLPASEKTLLLQHYVDGLTTEQLGRMRGVHRVTVSRRLVRARRQLLAAARSHLVDQLALSTSECDSVLRLVRSQLDITLERVLG